MPRTNHGLSSAINTIDPGIAGGVGFRAEMSDRLPLTLEVFRIWGMTEVSDSADSAAGREQDASTHRRYWRSASVHRVRGPEQRIARHKRGSGP